MIMLEYFSPCQIMAFEAVTEINSQASSIRAWRNFSKQALKIRQLLLAFNISGTLNTLSSGVILGKPVFQFCQHNSLFIVLDLFCQRLCTLLIFPVHVFHNFSVFEDVKSQLHALHFFS
jgi:hypothetical protein